MLGCQGSKKNGNSCTDDYGGTSYAAPVWAGFFALANQASAAAGNGTLGFINPELYAAGESSLFSANYHDVTACLPSSAGETTGPDCNSPDEGTKTQGYNPVAGFDDVTGWGSPSGIGLIDALSIPTLVISAAPYTTVSSITFTANFPEADGTVTFTAKAGSAAATTIGTCTVASGTCSKTVPGSALGVGTYTIQAVYQEISTSTKKYSATQNITVTYGLTFTSVSHNFGQVAVGTAASAYGINVKNTGTVAYPFTLVFTPANGFTSANNCGSSVAAGAACELVFYFTPTTNSAVSATWSLTAASSFSYSPSNGGTLTGSGTGGGGLSLTTNGHNFGTVAANTTSPAYGTVLSNSTASAVTLTLGSVSGAFASLTNCKATLAAGASCNLEFTFSPGAVTTEQYASFSVAATSGGQPVPITANGVTTTAIALSGK